jgi:MscS family membrane protein
VFGFVAAGHQPDYQRAAGYLNTHLKGEAAASLAKELYTVLDQRLPANLERLSDKPEGALDDNLGLSIERVGVVSSAEGPVDILLERVQRNGSWIWLFSAETLKNIPEVADEVESASADAFAPTIMTRKGWLSIAVWKWLAFLVGIALATVLSALVRYGIVRLLRPVIRRITKQNENHSIEALAGPLRTLILLAILQITVHLLMLPLFVRQMWFAVWSRVMVITVAWLFLRLVRIGGELMRRRMESSGLADRTALIRLGQRTLNVMAAFVVIVLLLRSAGYDVSAVLAGLGVGGIAIAFAAQKTLENLFGGISVIFDKPIRVGDACRIGDRVGIIEDIGLRSTRVRTLERTVLTVPNGQLSTMNLENFSLRDKFWFRHQLGVRYETTADQMRFLLAEIRRLLYAHPMVEASTSRVRLIGYSQSSVDLEIFAYIVTIDNNRFLEVQEDLLLRIRDIIDLTGTGFAFPLNVTYIAKDQGLDGERTQRSEEAVRQWREKGELPFPDFSTDRIAEMRNGIEYPERESAVRAERSAL